MAVVATTGRAEDLAGAALAVARRFAAGATMWCVSPTWPEHGRHVAVEFVHPVVVGTRALPAVHVESADIVSAVRLLSRAGDIVLAVGPSEDDRLARVLRRAEAWGLTSLWLGAGGRPSAGAADHILWADGPADVATRSGELVLLYHLLWELTHVVFEHPGLLEPPAACDADVCITCSDEGRVAEVVGVGDYGSAEVVAGGSREAVDVSLIDPVSPGDLVLVHAGVAITTIPERQP